jgi:hypothetical protein
MLLLWPRAFSSGGVHEVAEVTAAVLAATALLALMPSGTAHADTVSYVASNGDDGSCSTDQPCLSLDCAINKTGGGGTVLRTTQPSIYT